MSTAKAEIAKIVDSQPDDSSFEEIVREIVFRVIIERGLKDSNEGRVITDNELTQRIKKW